MMFGVHSVTDFQDLFRRTLNRETFRSRFFPLQTSQASQLLLTIYHLDSMHEV